MVEHVPNGKRYKIWVKKTLFFTLKIKIGKKFISRSAKGPNKNIIAKIDNIWLNMFRMGRGTILGLKTLFYTLKMRYKIFARKLGTFMWSLIDSALPVPNASL